MTDVATAPRLQMTEVGGVVAKLQRLLRDLPPGEQAVMSALLRAARVAETTPLQYNPYLPGVFTDPYPHYARLRAENPAHWSATIEAWVLTRFEDVHAALTDTRLASGGTVAAVIDGLPETSGAIVPEVGRFLSHTLNQTDPPEHTAFRALFTRTLDTALIARARPAIQAEIDRLVAAVAGRPEFEIVETISRPLPGDIACLLLGIPEADRGRVVPRVAEVMYTFSDGFDDTPAMARGEAALRLLSGYMRDLIAQRRSQPRDDGLSSLLADPDASPDAVLSVAIQFLMGVYEPLRHTVSMGVWVLLRHRAAWERLCADPSAIPAAVEELFRWETISPVIARVAREDLTIGGCEVKAGQQVVLLLPSANRDECKFADAATFVADRRPNAHLAFGAGIHRCPGAGLTRQVVTMLLGTLLRACPGLTLSERPPVWREEANTRGLVELWLCNPRAEQQSG